MVTQMESSPKDNDLYHRLKLVRCNLQPATLHLLLSQFSSAGSVFDATENQLQNIGVNNSQIKRIQALDSKDIERDLAWLDHIDHGILFYDDPAFPQQLLEISDHPMHCFILGT